MSILAYIAAFVVIFTLMLPCFSFDLQTHYKAAKKALFILPASFSPAILSFLMTGKFDILEMKDLYIYTASFLPPVIYWFYEDLELRKEGQREEKIFGAWFLLAYTFSILIVTAFCFSATKPAINGKESSIKDPWVIEQLPWLPLALMLATFILWYFTIASEKKTIDSYPAKKWDAEKKFLEKVTTARKK